MRLPPFIFSLAVAVSAASITFAEWTLIDDFEGDPGSPKFTFTVNLGSRESPVFNYGEDPVVGSSNTVFFADPFTYGTEWTDMWVNWPLPEPIDEGAIGTLFFRFYSPAANSMNPVLGLSDVPVSYDETTNNPNRPLGWADYEAATGLIPTLGVRNGGSYVTTDGADEIGVWWKVWVVVDNENDWATYYVESVNQDQTLVQIPAEGGPYDEALFRNGTTDPLVGFVYGINAGDPNAPNSGIPMWIDDVYVDTTGENLSDPTATTGVSMWGPFEILEGNYVNTGNWYGWIYLVPNTGWIWCYDLNAYIFTPEPAEDATGNWSYIPRN
jgi:hypothetical protein